MNVKQDRALSELIRSLNQPNFPEVLGNFVKKTIPFDNMIAISYYKDHNPEILYRESLIPDAHTSIDTQYVQAAYLLDPFFQAISNGVQTGIYGLFDLAPDQFKQSTYFKEYYQGTTIIDEFAIFSSINHDTIINICFARDKVSNKCFSKHEMTLIKSFEATLAGLCEIHWRRYQPFEGENINLPNVSDRLRLQLNTDRNIQLSPRQAEVALLILQGHSSLSIALQLGVSKETIKVFRKQLYAKCNISSQAELFTLLMPIMSLL